MQRHSDWQCAHKRVRGRADLVPGGQNNVGGCDRNGSGSDTRDQCCSEHSDGAGVEGGGEGRSNVQELKTITNNEQSLKLELSIQFY